MSAAWPRLDLSCRRTSKPLEVPRPSTGGGSTASAQPSAAASTASGARRQASPRAAIRAGDLAEYAQFFSFGTNDLTQTTLGISRDDAENGFLTEYLRTKVLKDNPFASIDQEGVGQLVAGAVEKGRKANPELSLGICGEHGGDPDSIHFFNKTGLDYVSCSPFRVPIARFAAAQAVISQQEK